MCGKDKMLASSPGIRQGSPPHVRERPPVQVYLPVRDGITPACAGKTPSIFPLYESFQDHPRMCGKDKLPNGYGTCYRGSPPHVRERLYWGIPEPTYLGITPACAGKTGSTFTNLGRSEDHPRMCGKDSNGSLYFRPFTPADIQNLFNFFAKHLTSSASPNAR